MQEGHHAVLAGKNWGHPALSPHKSYICVKHRRVMLLTVFLQRPPFTGKGAPDPVPPQPSEKRHLCLSSGTARITIQQPVCRRVPWFRAIFLGGEICEAHRFTGKPHDLLGCGRFPCPTNMKTCVNWGDSTIEAAGQQTFPIVRGVAT